MADPGPAQGPGFQSSAPAGIPSGAEDLRLPKPPGFIRSFFNRHPWLLDSIISAVYVLPMAVWTLVRLAQFNPGSAWLAVVIAYVGASGGVALLFRRRVPLITAGVSAAILLATPALGTQTEYIPMLFALYAVAVYHSTRAAWVWAAIGWAAGSLGQAIAQPNQPASIAGSAFVYALVLLVATLIGITFGNRRRYIQALLDRAAQLARERDQQAQLSVAAERARIAREMHDIVAHSLTVIVALSDGAEASVETSPARAQEAMRQAAATARRALTDMRRSLGVLTASSESTTDPAAADAPLAPQPGVADLAELIAGYRAAGLPVRYTSTGEPPTDSVVQLTVFRVVQEALTNALRYAQQPTAVDVTVAYATDGLVIEVADDGATPVHPVPSVGWGRGIIGMRERVAVHGGSVTAGPATPQGWRVRASIGSPAAAEGERPDDGGDGA